MSSEDLFSSNAATCDETTEIEVIDAPGKGDRSAAEANVPAISTPLKALIDERNYKAKQIIALADAIKESSVMNYFLEGYSHENTSRPRSNIGMFDAQSGIAALDSECWARAIRLTDVLEMMPAQQRNEWSTNLRDMNVPPFEEETVMSTILDLLLQRENFFAQKVDGVFRALSGDHVTNCPEGFGKRMIMAGLYDSLGYQNHRRVAYIHDLRTVIARVLGREEPTQPMTTDAFRSIERDGQWYFWDGGCIRLRCYKVGTCHVEIHPEIAWQLNKVLASLYPLAIPAQHRTRPPKPHKEYKLRDDMLSSQVLNSLQQVRTFSEPMSHEEQWQRRNDIKAGLPVSPQAQCASYEGKDWRREVFTILEMIGGVKHRVNNWYAFDYNPSEVISEILRTGCLPDRRSFQFYPTPEELAHEVVTLADVGDDDTVLEPSAGAGGLAKLLPQERTTCVEVSKLHCMALRTMGLTDVHNLDFLGWAPGRTFTKVVMNPPFSEGRAVAHVQKALSILSPGGRLVAILPPSAKNQLDLTGLHSTWSSLRDNLFDNTTVSVVILTVDKPPL